MCSSELRTVVYCVRTVLFPAAWDLWEEVMTHSCGTLSDPLALSGALRVCACVFGGVSQKCITHKCRQRSCWLLMLINTFINLPLTSVRDWTTSTVNVLMAGFKMHAGKKNNKLQICHNAFVLQPVRWRRAICSFNYSQAIMRDSCEFHAVICWSLVLYFKWHAFLLCLS